MAMMMEREEEQLDKSVCSLSRVCDEVDEPSIYT